MKNNQSKKSWLKLCALMLVLAGVLAACVGSIMSRVDEPKYKIIESRNDIEIREYVPVIVAEVDVTGERMEAINQGFRMIAEYIFGGNAPAQKIAMTAPVTQQAETSKGQKIPMTAPVIQQSSGVANSWKVRFVMPENYTLDTLPKPNNDQVKLLEVPAKKFAVIRFSGFNSDSNISSHRESLLEFIANQKLETVGEPIMAFYNPPWTLPFLKRNEIMIELKQ